MNDTTSHQLLTQIIENALLHLYCTVSAAPGFTPRAKRNSILAKWLKPKINNPAYKPIKGELKRMVLVTKRKDGDLEGKLHELHRMAVDYQQDLNDAKKLFDLLNVLHKQHGIDSKLFDEQAGPGELANTLYVLPDHIEHCFDDGGRQLAPVSLFIREGKYKELPALINDTGLFYAEVKETCEETRQAHIQLHPGTG